jgi:(S)-ureidoglycine aminohydrolase
MTNLFPSLRTVVKDRYALLSPESFVASNLPGWSDVNAVVQISPAMGAGFAQTLVTFGGKGHGAGRTDSNELFAFVVSGRCGLTASERTYSLTAEAFAYLPPGTAFEFGDAGPGTKLLLFEKRWEPSADSRPPEVLVGEAASQVGQPFLGDPGAKLQILLPETPAFDLAVNIFNYEPGAMLPFVESHVMEHGLLMLGGQGVYRFDQDWHPVQAGDAVWMAPYCLQWFVAMGKTPARYIYYKNVNRAPSLP